MSAVHSDGQDVRPIVRPFTAETRPIDRRPASDRRRMGPPPARRSSGPAQRSHAPVRGCPSPAPCRSEPAGRHRSSRSVDPVAHNGGPGSHHDNIRPTSVAHTSPYGTIATHRRRIACPGVTLAPHRVAAHEHHNAGHYVRLEIPAAKLPPDAQVATRDRPRTALVSTRATSWRCELARLSPSPTLGRSNVGRGRPAASSA
jgi:hypothetical protein